MIALNFIVFTKVGAALCVGGMMLVLLYSFVLMVLYAIKKALR